MLSKTHARTLIGLLAATALVAAVLIDLFGVATLENRHIMVLSGISSAALGLDFIQHRYEVILEAINAATDPWGRSNDTGDSDDN